MTLQSDIQAVIDAGKFEAGLAAWNIETGEQFDIHGQSPFPMASVFKIPVLAAAGQQLKQGKISLDQRIELTEETKSTGSGNLRYLQTGISPTLRDLLTLMIIISDNTATDMNIALLGGPLVVEKYMHELGLNDIYLKMDCKNLLKSLFPPEIRDLSLDEISAWSDENDVLRDGLAFQLTPENNISSALAMNQLLHMLYQGEIVQGALQDELMGILLKQQLNQRLPRFLPYSVRFAHKTGTIGGTTNDSGIMYVNDHCHVIVTLFTIWNDAAFWKQPESRSYRLFEVESAMGKIGQLIYNHYRRT